MSTFRLRAAGVVVAAGIAAVVLGISADRAVRVARLDGLIERAGDRTADPAEIAERLRVVLAGELAHARPDPEAVAAVLAVARSLGREEPAVAGIERWAADRLTEELNHRPLREGRLRAIYDLLLASGSSGAGAWLERIALAGGSRAGDIAALEDATAALRTRSLGRDGDDAYRTVLAVRLRALTRPGTTWAALALPPLGPVVAAADEAALLHLARAARLPGGADDRERLRLLWRSAESAELSGRLSAETVANIAEAMRRETVPWSGIAIGLGATASLVWALLVAMALVRRGPKLIDPSAETIENVEPIDLDTDAETLQRATTGSGDDPLP